MNEEELQKQLEECEAKKQEYFAGWQREKADFINYKQKEDERLNTFIDFLKENMIRSLISVLDSFDIAQKSMPEEEDKNTQGLLQIGKQLEGILKVEGLKEIECNEFDPSLHEAVGEVESEDKDGTIAEVVEKGYRYRNKVIRPAKVKINKKKD